MTVTEFLGKYLNVDNILKKLELEYIDAINRRSLVYDAIATSRWDGLPGCTDICDIVYKTVLQTLENRYTEILLINNEIEEYKEWKKNFDTVIPELKPFERRFIELYMQNLNKYSRPRDILCSIKKELSVSDKYYYKMRDNIIDKLDMKR